MRFHTHQGIIGFKAYILVVKIRAISQYNAKNFPNLGKTLQNDKLLWEIEGDCCCQCAYNIIMKAKAGIPSYDVQYRTIYPESS